MLAVGAGASYRPGMKTGSGRGSVLQRILLVTFVILTGVFGPMSPKAVAAPMGQMTQTADGQTLDGLHHAQHSAGHAVVSAHPLACAIICAGAPIDGCFVLSAHLARLTVSAWIFVRTAELVAQIPDPANHPPISL